MVTPTSKAVFFDDWLGGGRRGDRGAEQKGAALGRMSGRSDKANCLGILIDMLFPFFTMCFSFCFGYF